MQLVQRKYREQKLMLNGIPEKFLENIGNIQELRYLVEKPDGAYQYIPHCSNYTILKGKEIILAVESKQFTDQQIVWSIGMKELLSAAHAVKRYTNLIEGRKFLLITDCKSVYYLLKNRKEMFPVRKIKLRVIIW